MSEGPDRVCQHCGTRNPWHMLKCSKCRRQLPALPSDHEDDDKPRKRRPWGRR
jgi:DNA-directed RNA polymerase subunit RPC12/RpoP